MPHDLPPNTVQAPSSRLRKRDQLALSAYWFATNLHWGALLVIILPSQVDRMAPTNAANVLAMILGVGALIALVMPPIVGAFSDRCVSPWGRRRPYMAAGVTINLLGLVVLWYAGSLLNVWLYLAGYLVVQIGNNLATASYSGIIPDIVPQEQRGEASGYMAAMTQSGSVLGALLCGFLMGAGHILASYLLLAVVLVAFLGITLVGVRETPLAATPPPLRLRDMIRSLWINPREHPNFAWVWITRALVTMGMWMVQPFIQYYMRDILNASNPEQMAGLLMAVILVGATVTGFLGGRVSDKIGRKRVVYCSNTVIAVATIAFLFSQSVLFTFVVGAIYGLGYGAYYSVDWALGCDVLPNPEDAAKDMGVWHIAMVLPQSIAPFIAGPILQSFGQTPAGHYHLAGYSAIFVMAAFFLILGAFLLRNVKGVR